MMPAVGKVRAQHELQNFSELSVGIVDQRDGGVDDLGEIVRRNFCGHADGDSVGAVDQKIGNARGKNVGLDLAAVVVIVKVDGLFVEIFQKRCGNLRELGLGVTIGGRRISVDRTEVALTENQRIAHAPGLRQAHERVIHSKVAVRMILAHDLADDAGALARGPVRLQPHLLHRKKYAAVHGFQAVADVGKGAADDHRHGIVEIGPLHLLFNVDGLNVQRTGAIAAGRRSEGKFGILIVWHSLALSCQLSACTEKRGS